MALTDPYVYQGMLLLCPENVHILGGKVRQCSTSFCAEAFTVWSRNSPKLVFLTVNSLCSCLRLGFLILYFVGPSWQVDRLVRAQQAAMERWSAAPGKRHSGAMDL